MAMKKYLVIMALVGQSLANPNSSWLNPFRQEAPQKMLTLDLNIQKIKLPDEDEYSLEDDLIQLKEGPSGAPKVFE